jgi:hypothetical protein
LKRLTLDRHEQLRKINNAVMLYYYVILVLYKNELRMFGGLDMKRHRVP